VEIVEILLSDTLFNRLERENSIGPVKNRIGFNKNIMFLIFNLELRTK